MTEKEERKHRFKIKRTAIDGSVIEFKTLGEASIACAMTKARINKLLSTGAFHTDGSRFTWGDPVRQERSGVKVTLTSEQAEALRRISMHRSTSTKSLVDALLNEFIGVTLPNTPALEDLIVKAENTST